MSLGGSWVSQSVKRLTSSEVMISRSVGLGPASGSVLTAQSLEPASDSVSISLLLPHSCSVSLYLYLKNKQTLKKTFRGTWVAQLVKHPTLA